jgi:hypothetical protein
MSFENVSKSKNIGENLQIKIVCKKRSRAHCIQRLLTTIRLLPMKVNVKIYKTIILPIILYGYGTWSFTLREERTLMVLRRGCCGEYLDL